MEEVLKKKIILAVVGLVIFVLGIWAGMLYQSKNPKIEQAIKVQPTVDLLSSSVVQMATAFGSVQKINGRILTLAYGGDQIDITISNSAQIFSSTPQKDASGKILPSIPQPVDFKTIKIGDQVTVTFKPDASGSVIGSSVYIFSSLK